MGAAEKGEVNGAVLLVKLLVKGEGARGGFWNPKPVFDGAETEADPEAEPVAALSSGLGTLYFLASFENISTSRPCLEADTNGQKQDVRTIRKSNGVPTLYFSSVRATSFNFDGLCF